MERRVVQIEAAITPDPALLGGKAASLVRLLDLAAAVPPAFVLTTTAYRDWTTGSSEELVKDLIQEGLEGLKTRSGRDLCGGSNGLIVSVRSGAPVSMPGMMDTVLNVGF